MVVMRRPEDTEKPAVKAVKLKYINMSSADLHRILVCIQDIKDNSIVDRVFVQTTSKRWALCHSESSWEQEEQGSTVYENI